MEVEWFEEESTDLAVWSCGLRCGGVRDPIGLMALLCTRLFIDDRKSVSRAARLYDR